MGSGTVLVNDFNPLVPLFILTFKLSLMWPVGPLASWLLCLCAMSLSIFEHFHSFWHNRSFRLLLYFPFLSAGISQFSKELGSFQRRTVSRSQGVLQVHSLLLEYHCSQVLSVARAQGMYVCMHTHILASAFTYVSQYIENHEFIQVPQILIYHHRVHSNVLFLYLYFSLTGKADASISLFYLLKITLYADSLLSLWQFPSLHGCPSHPMQVLTHYVGLPLYVDILLTLFSL